MKSAKITTVDWLELDQRAPRRQLPSEKKHSFLDRSQHSARFPSPLPPFLCTNRSIPAKLELFRRDSNSTFIGTQFQDELLLYFAFRKLHLSISILLGNFETLCTSQQYPIKPLRLNRLQFIFMHTATLKSGMTVNYQV